MSQQQATLFSETTPKHDAGGKTRVPVKHGWKCDATFSECEKYRFRLSRTWSNKPADDLRLVFFLWMNCSVGSAEIDDPTIIRGCNLAKFWGYDGILVANVNPYCATYPKDMIMPPESIIVENLRHIHNMALHAELHVIAHGKMIGKFGDLAERTVAFLRNKGYSTRLHHLGLSTDGTPLHLLSRGKLFVSKTAQPILWEPKR